MTVRFNIVERGDPRDPTAPKKFYPSIVASKKVTLRDIVRRVAEMSTVSSADTMAVVEAFLTVIPSELSEGNIVSLGEFGSFWLRIRSEGAENEEDVSRFNIINVLPRFTPGKEFKQLLRLLNFSEN
jgi:predicted histone-like DNA-binding protein